MENRKVQIQSMVDYKVSLAVPHMHFSRIFNKVNQSAKVDFDVMEEGLQLTGFRNIFSTGILKIVDKQDRIDLGLEADDEEDEIEPIVTLSNIEIIKMLKSGKVEEIEEALKNGSTELRSRFIRMMITNKIYDYNLIGVLEKYAPNQESITDLMKLASDMEKEIVTEE